MACATADSPSKLMSSISPIRKASRQLVREWGFLRTNIAGSDLSPAAVHCLLEIGDHDIHDAFGLGQVLLVTPDELDSTLQQLLSSGHVRSDQGDEGQYFHITSKGRQTLVQIHAVALDQVKRALEVVPPQETDRIVEGLRLYADALQSLRLRSGTPAESMAATKAGKVDIVQGYVPGILGRTVELHMNEYHRTQKWGRIFETELTADLNALLARLPSPLNQIWTAVERSPGKRAPDRILGTIWLDGEAKPGEGHLRAFIVDGQARGLGLGRKLIGNFMRFVVEETTLARVTLTTKRELEAARKLYEEFGFTVVDEKPDFRWGHEMQLMVYSWDRVASEA